jgi:signal transduction histidine kinase/ActR/RegA family two-component response regulator
MDNAFRYDPILSMVSMAAAALGAGLAFLIVSRSVVTRFHIVTGGGAMGLAIASMHYLGMASMRIPATIQYNPYLFAASIAIAIGASGGALALAGRPIVIGQIRYWVKLVSAVAMGVAIAGMHYVGMAAARYIPTGSTLAGEGAMVGSWSLQTLLISAGLVILCALIAMAAKTAAERQVALESLKESRNEAIEALKAKDAFLASLSHELRTPLNPALLLATDCSSNSDFPPAAREAFAMISRNILLEARLIDDLLDATRISRGLLKIEPRVVDVHTILNDAIRVIRTDLTAKNLELTFEFNAEKTSTSADPGRLQQVFWNLLLNAAKFSLPGGLIHVRTYNDGPIIGIQVSDSGIGMTPAEIARCFEIFEQGEHNLGGLGLGLSISRSIVDLHGGSIIAASPGRGHGTTMSVTLSTLLPKAAPIEQPPEAVPSAPHTTKLSVLLVEDHDASRIALERLLRRRGHNVVATATYGDALQAGQRTKFDVLISDIGLPDGDGYQLMRKLRALQPLIGIAVTGYGREEDLRQAKAAGFSTHVTKPVTIRRLDEVIALAISGSNQPSPDTGNLQYDTVQSGELPRSVRTR